MDQCKHCIIRGDIGKCVNTPCAYHETWYAMHQDAAIKELVEALKLVEGIREIPIRDRDIIKEMLAKYRGNDE